MAITSAAIIGGAGLIGGYLTNQTNSANAAQNNATSIELANTAYQRRVADLSKAGLNPMLAYQQGGAAVPNLVTPDITNSVGNAASSAVAGYQAAQQGKLIDAQIGTQQTAQTLNTALATKAQADADVSLASAGEIRARTPTYAVQISKMNADIDNIASQTGLNVAQTDLVKRQAANALLTGNQIVAQTGNFKADLLLKQIQVDMSALKVPAAINAAAAADSWIGRVGAGLREFNPFGSAKDAGSAFGVDK